MGAMRRGMRNAFRNAARTVSVVLVLAVAFALAIAMFVAHQAADQRVQTATSNLGTTIVVTPAGSFGGFGFGGNPLTSTQVADVAALPHVTSVAATVTQRLAGANEAGSNFGGFTDGTTSLSSPLTIGSLGRHSFGGGRGGGGRSGSINPNTPLPISVVGTTQPLDAAALRASTVTLTSGVAVDGSSSALDADVGSTLASKNALKVGSTFVAYSSTLKVVGIFQADAPDANAEIVLPLATEEHLSGVSGVTQLDATADTLGDVPSVATAIQQRLGASAVNVTTSQSNSSSIASDLSSIKTVSLFSLVGAIIAAAAILLLTMLLIVRERRREIGILKAFGSSNRGVVGSFVTESLTLTVMAAAIGVVLGVLLSNPVLNALKGSSPSRGPGGFAGGFGGGAPVRFGAGNFFGTGGLSQLHAVFSGSVVAYALLAVAVVALVGSAIPAFATSKVRPAEALRSDS